MWYSFKIVHRYADDHHTLIYFRLREYKCYSQNLFREKPIHSLDTVLLEITLSPKAVNFVVVKVMKMIHFKLTKAVSSSEFSDHLLSVIRLSVYQSVSKLFSFSSPSNQTWHMVQTQTRTKICLILVHLKIQVSSKTQNLWTIRFLCLCTSWSMNELVFVRSDLTPVWLPILQYLSFWYLITMHIYILRNSLSDLYCKFILF